MGDTFAMVTSVGLALVFESNPPMFEMGS